MAKKRPTEAERDAAREKAIVEQLKSLEGVWAKLKATRARVKELTARIADNKDDVADAKREIDEVRRLEAELGEKCKAEAALMQELGAIRKRERERELAAKNATLAEKINAGGEDAMLATLSLHERNIEAIRLAVFVKVNQGETDPGKLFESFAHLADGVAVREDHIRKIIAENLARRTARLRQAEAEAKRNKGRRPDEDSAKINALIAELHAKGRTDASIAKQLNKSFPKDRTWTGKAVWKRRTRNRKSP